MKANEDDENWGFTYLAECKPGVFNNSIAAHRSITWDKLKDRKQNCEQDCAGDSFPTNNFHWV
eukprot:CAMPEP_0197001804 /NCGR_PEP_ID=MMETSP1380-20130617/6423_1 /TAXON_ID=5936 /ORGANISM="Euplotes crassus, Strain CT5" /LENGTH=62 /DNA_ID=CAMNT_0042419631 /DNA_START=544 /DNA_END=732 /DNA_ORIENTATION=+